MRPNLFILLLILGAISLSAQEGHNVTIKLLTENIGDKENIYISGNNSQLGNWQPDKIKLEKVDNHWEREFFFPPNTTLEFKFTKGTWQTEALDDNGNIRSNFNLTVINDTTLIFDIKNWKDSNYTQTFSGGITGKVVLHKNFKYKNLLPRDVIVWLPPGYKENNDKHYPVLYMHDGQNLFDPATSYTGIDWQVDETADSLIKNGIIEPTIIVGINNTSDRSNEYGEGKKAIDYMQFIVTKLKPFIDKKYRTKPDRENTIIGGSSMGGLISFMLAWNYSSIFSKAICFSPAFKYKNYDYTEYIKNYNGPKKSISFYFYNGGIGLEKILQPGVDKMVEILKAKEFNIGKDLVVEIDSTAEHNENSWAKWIDKPLKLFFGKKKINSNISLINPERENILSKRFRIQTGFASSLNSKSIRVNIPYFFNINFRNSNIDSAGLEKMVNFSFSNEVGMNIFIEEFFILPYVKLGPEIRINKYLYFDVHAGLSLTISSFGYYPIPFIGSEAGYIFPISKSNSIEFEVGTNGISSEYIYYFTVSITI